MGKTSNQIFTLIAVGVFVHILIFQLGKRFPRLIGRTEPS